MKEIIKTDKAPAAIGPYSQAIKISGGSIVFLSGIIPLNPKTMEIVGKTAGEQCKQVMDNMGHVLKEAGGEYVNVVKTTIYLSDLADFGPVNEMYGTYFDVNPPARATVEVNRLPKDVKIEIEAIAII
jgi:2-iminobutanoate/2-iminopropanoate deaminase